PLSDTFNAAAASVRAGVRSWRARLFVPPVGGLFRPPVGVVVFLCPRPGPAFAAFRFSRAYIAAIAPQLNVASLVGICGGLRKLRLLPCRVHRLSKRRVMHELASAAAGNPRGGSGSLQRTWPGRTPEPNGQNHN